MRGSSSSLALYQRPECLRTSDVVPGSCWSSSPSLGDTAPNTLVPHGTKLDFHTFSSCSFGPCFSCSSCRCCCQLYLSHLSHLPSSAACLPPQWLVDWPAAARQSNMFLYTLLATWLCLLVYTDPACMLHPATVCWSVSGSSLRSWHLGSCLHALPQPL